MLTKQLLQSWIEQYLAGTEYELVTLDLSPTNEILVEVDRLAGVDVDFCAELNRYLVEKLDNPSPALPSRESVDYSLEVGSVSLTDPFKTKMQFEKNLGHVVEVMVSTKGQSTKDQVTKGQSTKYKGLLVSVDEDTFSVDIEEKVKVVESQKAKVKRQIVTHTWRYDEPKYVKYDLKF